MRIKFYFCKIITCLNLQFFLIILELLYENSIKILRRRFAISTALNLNDKSFRVFLSEV